MPGGKTEKWNENSRNWHVDTSGKEHYTPIQGHVNTTLTSKSPNDSGTPFLNPYF